MNGKLKTNFLYNVGYQVLLIILPLITAPYVSRTLGAYNVGVYSYTQAFANYFMLFAMLGVNNYGNRTIAQVRDNNQLLKKTFWEIYIFQFGVSIFVLIAYFFSCALLIKENTPIYYIQSFMVLSGAFDVNWFCFGVENFKLTTIRSTIVRIVTTILIFVFVRNPDDLWIYVLILSASSLLSALAIWPFVIRTVGFTKITLESVVKHIKPNLVLFVPVIAISLYNLMDKLMLGYFSTKEEVAFYTYAHRIIEIPLSLILALDNVIMPRMANLYASKSERASSLMDFVMLFAMCMSSAMAFGLASIGREFAPIFYGSSYLRCGLYIVLLSPVLIFKGWASAIRTQFIIPTGKDKIYIISIILGAIVNLILNMLLIPSIKGTGAIIGTLCAEMTVCFMQYFMSSKYIVVKKYLYQGLGFILIGCIMYCLISFWGGLNTSDIIKIMIKIASGVIVYVVLSIIYIVYILKNPIFVNYVLESLHIKHRFNAKS